MPPSGPAHAAGRSAPAGKRTAGPRPAAGRSRAVPAPRTGVGRLLAIVLGLALLGLAGVLLAPRMVDRMAPAEARRPADPARTWIVAENVDRRQMQPVWTLVNMSGIDRICEKARAYTVTRQSDARAVPTRFIVYCRDQGFWVVEADAAADRFATLGPLATPEEAEAMIDQGGNFLWGARPPGQRSFVGGLADR